MAPPAALVRTARCLWQWEWQQLMGGLGPADQDGNYRRPPGAFLELPPLPGDASEPGSHVLIVGRSCPWAHRAWLVWSLRQLQESIELLVVEPDPQAGDLLIRYRVMATELSVRTCHVDGDHGFAEAIQLCARFRLGRLDHQRSSHRPTEGRSVEAVVHQPLGYILGGDLLELAQVQDALMRHAPVCTVKGREIRLQPLGNVIRIQDGNPGRRGQSHGTHHLDVHP